MPDQVKQFIISLTAIREAHSVAFSEKVRKARTDKIDAALADKSLDALSVIRNLIVHKGGIADSNYVKDAKNAPAAPQLKENEVLHLDGEKCRNLILPVVKLCVCLVEAVDSWLSVTRRK